MKENIEVHEVAVELSPCYMQPFLSLYHCDNMDLLRQTPDNYYSLSIVDPPYGLNFGAFNRTNKDSNGKHAEWLPHVDKLIMEMLVNRTPP